MAGRDPVADQMQNAKAKLVEKTTTSMGAPVGDKVNSLSVGPRGPILLQDFTLFDELIHFGRERIPERVVHAKGAGAHGYFEVTNDITQYCKAKIFSDVGKRTPLAVRFSTVGGESGSADTARDPRGFAVKFYTEEGNWDLVGNNTPIFFIRDAIMFPSFIHTQKRNPATNCKDPDMTWDFFSLRPETTHQVMFLYSDRGTPDGYRKMNGYGSHTFKMINSSGEAVYCKFHFKPTVGVKSLMADEAGRLEGEDPDYATRDLFNAIAREQFPEWNLFIQVMTFEQAEKWEFNPFDVTKVWPHGDYPLIPVGRMVLNKNPANYFAEVEQIAFSPSHLVPGIEASPDKMLQGRLVSYPDTHRHRLGTNYSQIPVNCPYAAKAHNYQRSGPMTVNGNQGGAPNYFPNSFNGPQHDLKLNEHVFRVESPDVKRYNSLDEDNFTQPGIFWRKVLSEEERERLCENIAGHLGKAQDFIIKRALDNFTKVHEEFGDRLRKMIEKNKKISQNGKL